MTPKDVERAIDEYETALAHIVKNVKCTDGRLYLPGGENAAPGLIAALVEDLGALNQLAEYFKPSGEPEAPSE